MRRWLILSVCAGLKVFNSNFPFAKTEIRIEDWIYKFNDYRCLNSQPLTLFMRQEYTNSSIAWRTDFYNSYFAQISTKKVISGEAGLGIDSPIKTLRVQTRSRCYAMMKYKDAGTVGEGTLTSDWSDFKETIRQKNQKHTNLTAFVFGLSCTSRDTSTFSVYTQKGYVTYFTTSLRSFVQLVPPQFWVGKVAFCRQWLTYLESWGHQLCIDTKMSPQFSNYHRL
jgi:hypothetical protein